jgi:hypothetical protein
MFFPEKHMAKKITSVECAARSFKLAFQPGTTVDIEAVNRAILESVQAHGIKAVMAYADDDRAVTMEELAENGISEDIPEDGREVVKALTFDFKEDNLFVKAGDEKYPLARLKLTIAYNARQGEGGNGHADGDGASEEARRAYISDVFIVTKSEAAVE